MLFASVDLPILDKQLASQEILSLPERYSFWDSYRNTKMIPLMTKGHGVTNFVNSEFRWKIYTPTTIKKWFDDIVFPWMGMQARVMALITQPNFSNYEHIDCLPEELNTQQHKFRIVLQGNTNTLYFITKDGNIHSPDISGPFIMDGGWPHGMINHTDEIKITLAVGSPWRGHSQYKNITELLTRDNYSMPDDLSGYWKKGGLAQLGER